jgi:cytidylate kinase
MKIDYYPLINKIISTFNIKNQLLKEAPPEEHFFEKPFITIAREPGSGGAPIAKRLGEKLNFRVRNESIVDAVAKSTKKRREIIKHIDEKGRTYVDDIIHSALNPEYVDENVFAKELSRVILTFAHQGNCIILGRGANFITPFARGLHVNIVAPYDVRVKRAMEFEGFSKRKAKAVIAKVEKEREEFVKTYFKKDTKKSNAYDLTLNTTHYSIDEAADVIIMAFRLKFPAFQRLKATLMR